jgi:hypothetical protein
MRQKSLVVSLSGEGWERLSLAPRLRADETLSSWMERFAGAYALKVREFAEWLRYRPLHSVYAAWRLDLDVSPPADFAVRLAPLTGLSAREIEAHQLAASGMLVPHLRRTFCPQCWAEEGPYRRREWASAWSLVCPRHRRLLSEKPLPTPPFARDYEESWPEFYQAANLWQEPQPSWQSERWRRICQALGVEPRTEFLRAWPWLLELSGKATATARPTGMQGLPKALSASWASRGCAVGRDLTANDLRVKHDLTLYGLIRFKDHALLQVLDETIASGTLIEDQTGGDICDVTTPQAPYEIRLFAAATARHIWERLTQGHWRCGHHQKIQRFLEKQWRWSDDDWWLEQRLRTWPAHLEASGRRLLRKMDSFVLQPPWERCRLYCVRPLQGAVRAGFSIQLPKGWRCPLRNQRGASPSRPP